MLLDVKHDPNHTPNVAPPIDDDQRTTSSTTIAPPIFEHSDNQLARSKRHHVLTLSLHIGLLALHVLLLVVWALGIENRIMVSPGASSAKLLLGITFFSQIIAIVYTASLVALTQKIAIRRNLHVPQPLASIHDKFSAWSGIGQAFVTLFRQGEVATGISGVATIVLYLTGISIILITTPALFSLLPTMTSTPISLPVSFLNTADGAVLGNIDDLSAVSVLSTLPILSSAYEQPGLSGNLFYSVVDTSFIPDEVYDRDQFTFAVLGKSKVNAASFEVTCGLLPSSYQLDHQNTPGGPIWDISTPVQNASIFPLYPGLLRIAPCPRTDDYSAATPDILIYGAVNITDSQNNTGTNIRLSPPVNAGQSDGSQRWSELQVIGCGLTTSYPKVKVSGQTSLLVSSRNFDIDYDIVEWEDWTRALPDPNVTDSWLRIMNTPIRSSFPASNCYIYGVSPPPSDNDNDDRPCGPPDFLNVVEFYVNKMLGLNLQGNETQPFRANLQDLETALGNATAAVYWAGHQQDLSTGTHESEVLLTQSQLNINFVPLIIGLTASILLLTLCIIFIRRPRGSTPPTTGISANKNNVLDSLGLLQFLWLFGKDHHHNSMQERVAEVPVPTTENLRRAGMFVVQMDGLRMRGEKIVDAWT